MMKIINKRVFKYAGLACIFISFTACKLPSVAQREENKTVPEAYNNTASKDTTSMAKIQWKQFFADPNLNQLIETALKNNQELNITLQEIEIAKNEIKARKGEYLPFVGLQGSAGIDKVARYTNIGAMEANTDIEPGRRMPEPVPNYRLGVYANWEVDIWKKLRNAKKAAALRYLSTVEGKNFMVTHLVSEIANSYYELLALDNQLEIVKKNIEIQSNAFEIVKLEKEATRVTELAVRRFEAEVLKTKSLQFGIQQRIVETENRINFLLARYPQPIQRDNLNFDNWAPATISSGLPSQLLANRPDIKQAEQELAASKLDVKVAKARFYPSLSISGGVGLQAFNPAYLVQKPESLLYNLVGDLAAPLINRNALKADYRSANARQIQAVFNYERTILNGYIEVANQLSNIDNLEKSYDLKSKQVQALTQSIAISTTLFKSARADYMEVLLTQRDALESKFDLVETKMQQMNAMVNIYKALGGGWN